MEQRTKTKTGRTENMKKEKMLTVYTVIPNDFELSTQHFEHAHDAQVFAKSYVDGASIVKQELPERVVLLKESKTARFGYKI